MFCTYRIENKINGKIYIGKSSLKNVNKRRYVHFNHSCNIFLKSSIIKYGKDNFEFSLIESYESEMESLEGEKFWIAELKKHGSKLYNLTEGGDGVSGYKMTEKTKAMLLKINLGSKHTEEHINKVREANLGKKRSIKSRENISKGKLGKKPSEEHRKNLSEAHKGYVMPEEQKKKIGAFSKGRGWKIIDGKRVWYDKEPKESDL